MTLTEQVKILDGKIKANKAEYDLDRGAAKISALFSGELEKYEYLTGEDLGYKLDVIQKANFEYSPLGKVFNKGLDENYKKEGLLKRLKNIEDKNEEQLKMIKNKENKQLGIKSVADIIDEELSQEAKNMITKPNNQEKSIYYKRLTFRRDKNLEFDFRDYRSLKELFKEIYYRKISIDRAEDIQKEDNILLDAIEEYKPKNPDYVKKKNRAFGQCKKTL